MMLYLIIILFYIHSALCAKSNLDETFFYPDDAYSEREGIYAKYNTPAGNGAAQIAFNFNYRPMEINNGTLSNPIVAEIALVHSSILKKIGRITIWQSIYCCDAERLLSKICTVPNRLIVADDLNYDPSINGNLFYYWSKNITGEVKFNETLEPLVSGIWYLIFTNCDLDLQRTLVFSGNTLWRSPFGFLPAQAFGNLIVYWLVALFYLVGLIIWGTYMIKNQKDLHKYQHTITFLGVISLIEEILKACISIDYNNNGLFNTPFIGVGIFFTALKLTLIRFLLLLISYGYAITLPSLTRTRLIIIICLCIAYFICTAADEYLNLASLERPQSPGTLFLTAALLIIFNAIIICWIICSTITSMKVAEKENNEKYPMYLNLLRIFGAICVVAIVAFFVVIVVGFAGLEDAAYQWYWLLDTYWDFIYFAITAYMAYVWRPTENNQRYAYVALNTYDQDQIELEDNANTKDNENDLDEDDDIESS